MTCESIRVLRTAGSEDREVLDHLNRCAECAGWERDLQTGRALLRELPSLPLPAGLAESIRRRALSAPRPIRLSRWIPALAAAVLIGLLVGYLWQSASSAPPPPPTGEAVHIKLGEHLQASRLFFRQVDKLDGTRPAEEMALARAEMEAVDLESRTEELLHVSTDPQVADYLAAVQESLRALKAGTLPLVQAKLRQGDILGRIERIENSTGIQSRPLQVSIGKAPKDAELQKFLEARASLYRGDYEQAVVNFKKLDESPFEEDARYWQGVAAGRKGDDMEALQALMGLSKGSWLDRETMNQLKSLAVKMNAKVGKRAASDVNPDDLRKIVQGRTCVLVLKTSKGKPLVSFGQMFNPGMMETAKSIPGFQVRQQDHLTWIEIDMERMGMEPSQRDLLLRALQESLKGSD